MTIERTLTKQINTQKFLAEVFSALGVYPSISSSSTSMILTFQTNVDETIVDALITNHSSVDAVANEVALMRKRVDDGKQRLVTAKAQIRLSRLQDNGSLEDYVQGVYAPMESVMSKIESGDWLDAYVLIGSVQPTQQLTQQMIIDWKIDIAKYIVGEGGYQEYTGKTVTQTGGITQ